MADIFLSYKRTDRDRVAPIVALLEARGWTVWWDTRIDAGEQWDEVIEREVGAASCVVAVWSFQSVNSRWVRIEASEGLERGILVPVLVDAAKPPLEFKRVQAIDLTEWGGEAEEGCARVLVGAVARLLGEFCADGGSPVLEAPGDPQAGGSHGLRLEWKRWQLVEKLRHGARAAAAQTERSTVAVKAGLAWLAWRARRANGVAVPVALLAALLVAGSSVLWLKGWRLADLPRTAPKVADARQSQADVVLAMGDLLVANNEVIRARELLEANESLAPGRISLAIGGTYDPNMLAALATRGVSADAEKARSFYRKARDLGVPGAAKRLEGLLPVDPPVSQKAGGRLRIVVAPAIKVARPAGQAVFAIEVNPRQALPDNVFVRIRGFPRQVSLRPGYSIAAGSWAVPMFELARIEVNAPEGVSGRTEITISLVAVDGSVLAEAKTNLEVVDPPPERREVAPVADKRPGLLATKSVLRDPLLSGTEKETPQRLLTKGAEHLKLGQIGAARLCFERVYEMGLAVGALEYAATYDPYELDRLHVPGATADRAEARKWYVKAIELGSREAEKRLQRMERFWPLR